MAWGGIDGVYERIHSALYNAVGQAAAQVQHLDGGWSEAEMSKKIVRHLYKGASEPELMNMPWDEACKEMVKKAMNGYTASCGDCGWFFDIDLVPAFMGAAMELVAASGQAVPPEAMHEVLQSEYEDALDRRMLDKALWEVISTVFSEEKVRQKAFQALSKAYWPALDEILNDGNLHREIMYGLDEATELRRVENFTRRWLDDGISRAWVSIEQSEAGLNEDTLMELVKQMLAPFGEDHPYSCLPGAFIDRLGRPPPDWAFIRTVVTDLFRSWSGDSSGPAKKKRKTNKKPYANGDDEFAQALLSVTEGEEANEYDPEEKPAEEVAEGFGHPKCTSADDCIGSPLHPLVRHLHNGKAGDIYCEPCWESFCQRNPNLKGVREEEEG